VIVNYGALESGTDLKHLLQLNGLVVIKNAQFLLKSFKDWSLTLGKPLKTEKHTIDEYVQVVSTNG
jgi:hypothetical protein